MLKIAINGIFGRMGQELTSAVEKSEKFQLVGGIDVKTQETPLARPVSANPEDIVPTADVVIDFSLPQGALKILGSTVRHKKALITGTTGFTNAQLEEFKKASKTIPIVQAFNFSIGVNLLSQLISQAAEVLKDKADIEIVETHHRNKKDSPSGTAVLLSQVIAEQLNISTDSDIQFGRHGKNLERKNEIGVHSLRGGSVIGEHQVFFLGENENVVLSHQALNRKIFVEGALSAAEWIQGKLSGLYGMAEVLGFAK